MLAVNFLEFSRAPKSQIWLLTSFHSKKKKNPNPSPKKKAGGKVGRLSEFCSSLLPLPRVEHSGPHPKSPASPLTQELNPPTERLNSGELGSLVVCPHLQQRKLEEKAIEAPLPPETIFLFLPTLVFPVFYLERVDLNVMSSQPSYKEKNVSLKE